MKKLIIELTDKIESPSFAFSVMQDALSEAIENTESRILFLGDDQEALDQAKILLEEYRTVYHNTKLAED